jgi:hypothetical protein
MDCTPFISPVLSSAGRRFALVVLPWFVLASACDDPAPLNLKRPDSGHEEEEEEEDAGTEGTADPGEARDARPAESMDAGQDTGATRPLDASVDSYVPPPVDSGPPDGGFWLDASNEAGVPIVIAPPREVMEALCSNNFDSVRLSTYANVTRGSWQINLGGPAITLPAPGYPCAAFLEERKSRPAAGDPGWTDAPDGVFLGFNETSTITTMDYNRGQFRYFRSLIYVPRGANLRALTVSATGIDDSVYLELTNTRYPMGVSPQDAGPSDPMVGACQGNGMGEWNLATYIAEGEVNVLLLVHADLAAATSTLTSVDIRADNMPIQLVSCRR